MLKTSIVRRCPSGWLARGRKAVLSASPWRLFAGALLFAFLTSAGADEPLAPPSRVVTCSKSGAICAESDPGTNRTSIRRNGSSTVLWAVDGWHRWMLVANSGDGLVVGYNGLNLVPPDVNLEFEVLHLYDRGRLVRTVRLGDLYNNLSRLRRTVSHRAWVKSIALNDADQLDVGLIDGRHKLFPLN